MTERRIILLKPSDFRIRNDRKSMKASTIGRFLVNLVVINHNVY